MAKCDEYHKICTLLDKLTLDSLTLIEQKIRNKIELEKCMSGGEMLLAKARYIMGHNSVSKIQLPNEESNEMNAVTVINRHENVDCLSQDVFDLEIRQATDSQEIHNPLNWFGVLVPRCLNLAQNMYKKAVTYVIKDANNQLQIQETFKVISQLKDRKNNLLLEE